MRTKTSDWSGQVSQELRDLEYAQIFLMDLLDAGDDLQTALGRLIHIYGIKEYAVQAHMAEPAIKSAMDPTQNPTKEILEALLAPLNLRLGVNAIV